MPHSAQKAPKVIIIIGLGGIEINAMYSSCGNRNKERFLYLSAYGYQGVVIVCAYFLYGEGVWAG
jgi:hypothetical protein